MKKFLISLFLFVLVFSLSACTLNSTPAQAPVTGKESHTAEESSAEEKEIKKDNIYTEAGDKPVNIEAQPDLPEDAMLCVLSGGKRTVPYQHFAYSGEWTEYGFLCGDGIPLASMLEQLVGKALIPQITYSEDFNVEIGERVKTQQILLFDENYAQLDTLQEIFSLAELDEGTYYVGIVASKTGDYIEEANTEEYIGYACVFKLIK